MAKAHSETIASRQDDPSTQQSLPGSLEAADGVIFKTINQLGLGVNVEKPRHSSDSERSALDAARRLAGAYSDQYPISVGLVVGSLARGTFDSRSDIDLELHWPGEVDPHVLRRRSGVADEQRLFAVATPRGVLEKFRIDGRLVDIEHFPGSHIVARLEELASVQNSAESIGVAARLVDGVPLFGREQLRTWQEELVYSDELVASEIRRHSASLVSFSGLFQVSAARGDMISYYARTSGMALRLVMLLAAANRRFASFDTPKWVPWWIRNMPVVPEDFLGRVEGALADPTVDRSGELDALALEVFEIISDLVAGADLRRASYAMRLSP